MLRGRRALWNFHNARPRAPPWWGWASAAGLTPVFGLLAGRACAGELFDQSQAVGCAWPMPDQRVGSGAPHDRAQGQRHDHGVEGATDSCWMSK